MSIKLFVNMSKHITARGHIFKITSLKINKIFLIGSRHSYLKRYIINA